MRAWPKAVGRAEACLLLRRLNHLAEGSIFLMNMNPKSFEDVTGPKTVTKPATVVEFSDAMNSSPSIQGQVESKNTLTESKTDSEREVKETAKAQSSLIGDGDLFLVPENSIPQGCFIAYKEFCIKNGIPFSEKVELKKLSFQNLPVNMRQLPKHIIKELIREHNCLLKEYCDTRDYLARKPKEGNLKKVLANLNKAEIKAENNQKLVEQKIETIANFVPQTNLQETNELAQFFKDTDDKCSHVPNFSKDRRVPDLVAALADARCSPLNVVHLLKDSAGRIIPSKQPGLAVIQLGTYIVVEQIVTRISMSTREVLFDPNVQSYAVQYAANILADFEKPPGKEGTGGCSYSGYADLGPDYIEIYAITSIIKAFQSKIMMWRATPRVTPLPMDWQLFTAIAAFVSSSAAAVHALPSTLASMLSVPVTMLIGDSRTITASLHKHFFPQDDLMSRVKGWFGFQTKANPEILHIWNNHDLHTKSYDAHEFAAAITSGFSMGPIAEAPLRAFHQLDSAMSQAYLAGSAQPSLELHGSPKDRGGIRDWALRSWDQLRSNLGSILQKATKTACLAVSCRELSCTDGQCQNRVCVPCESMQNCCIPNVVTNSSLNCLGLSQQREKPGYRDLNNQSETVCEVVSPPSIQVEEKCASKQMCFAREKRSKSLGESSLESPALNTWMTEIFAPAMTCLSAGLDHQCMPLRYVLKDCGTIAHGSILTCRDQMSRWANGTPAALDDLESSVPRSLIAPAWMRLRESLCCNSQTMLSETSELLPTYSQPSIGNSKIAQRHHVMGYGSTDVQCSALESPTPQ